MTADCLLDDAVRHILDCLCDRVAACNELPVLLSQAGDARNRHLDLLLGMASAIPVHAQQMSLVADDFDAWIRQQRGAR